MITIKEFTEYNPDNKTEEWANRLVSWFRKDWRPIVDKKMARDNMNILLSSYDDSDDRAMFKNPDKTGLSFIGLSVFEKYRNILISEKESAGVFVGLNCIDPAMVDAKRKRDKALLANRKVIEGVLSTLSAKIGDPGYKVKNSEFAGNVDMFDEMGLNDEDDENLNYFFNTFWKMLAEIVGEIPINYFIKYNRIQDKIPMFVNDILAKKAIALTTYVDQNSGAIIIDYLAPEQVFCIAGDRQDFKDAPAIGYEKLMTVGELIKHLGNEFNPEEDFRQFITGINAVYSQTYTGLKDNGGNYLYKNPQKDIRDCGWHEFMSYKLPLGYIEWKSIDATVFKKGNSVNGNLKMYRMKKQDEPIISEHYQKEVYNNEITYKAYYYPTSTQTQRLFKFGKLYHQTIEGGEDEYSNYSISAYKEVGPTAVSVINPYVKIIRKAWTKFEWMVRKSKPQGSTYNYEALVQIASNMIKSGDNATKVSALIEKFEEGINDIYTIPTINGNSTGGGGNPYFIKQNGLDRSAKDFLDVILWVNQKISDDLGLNNIREGGTPEANEGLKLTMESLQQSRHATAYISRMLMNVLNHSGGQALLMCQDIVKYKTSIPYKFLMNAVGENVCNLLSSTGFAFHRLGIFIESFNTIGERQKVIDFAERAFLQDQIDYAQLMLIKSIDFYKKAGFIFAYEQRRREKLKIEEQKQLHESNIQLENQKKANELEIIAAKGAQDIEKANVEGEWYYKAHKATADAQVVKKQMDIDAIDEKTMSKSAAEISKMREENNLLAQRP